MTFDFQKSVFPQIGTWRPTIRDGHLTATICCPNCHAIASLEPQDHSIAIDGVVRPSVICDCGFHERIRLLNWNGQP